MHAPVPRYDPHQRLIRAWLIAVAGLIFAMVLVGGATRLTQSGLSITEWRPVSGVVPPLSRAEWQAEFDRYKAIPQYRELNRGMSLAEFQTIFWWEWAHRLLGRVIGLAFLLPFLWFLWCGWIGPGLRWRLWTIFGLGAAQGTVGWWMVASGLAARTSVSQYRLAFHLTLACMIYSAILWTAQRLHAIGDIRLQAKLAGAVRRIQAAAVVLVVLVLAQIYLGALVAGTHAGLIYNTWPLIDGSFIPRASGLMFNTPWWRNFFENTLTVQFDHRMLAYTIFVLTLLHLADVLRAKRGGAMLAGALTLAGAVTLQAALGIVTLLHQAPLPLALAHQAVAMIVLTVAVVYAASVAAITPVAARGAKAPPPPVGATRITLPRAPARDRR